MLSFPGFLVQVQSFKSKFILAMGVRGCSKFMFSVILVLCRAACAPSWLRKMPKKSNMTFRKKLRQYCLEPRPDLRTPTSRFDSRAEPYTNGLQLQAKEPYDICVASTCCQGERRETKTIHSRVLGASEQSVEEPTIARCFYYLPETFLSHTLRGRRSLSEAIQFVRCLAAAPRRLHFGPEILAAQQHLCKLLEPQEAWNVHKTSKIP